MAYRVFIGRKAERDLKKIPKGDQQKILLKALKLRNNPRPLRARKTFTSRGYYRIRVGDWRIIYEVTDKIKQVSIFRIRHRREVYKNL